MHRSWWRAGVVLGLVMSGVLGCEVVDSMATPSRRTVTPPDVKPWGPPLWTARISPSGTVEDVQLAAAVNRVLVTGSFTGSLALGEVTLVADGVDGFAALFEAGGRLVRTEHFSGPGTQRALAAMKGRLGGFAVGGAFDGTLALASERVASRGGQDAFVAVFDSDLRFTWLRTGGDAADQAVLGGAIAEDGRVHVTGSFAGQLSFGDAGVSATDTDAYLAVFSDAGVQELLAGWGGPGDQRGRFFPASQDVGFVVVGEATGGLVFGGFRKEPLGVGADLFEVRFRRDGGPADRTFFGTDGDDRLVGATVDPGRGHLRVGYLVSGATRVVLREGGDAGFLHFDAGALIQRLDSIAGCNDDRLACRTPRPATEYGAEPSTSMVGPVGWNSSEYHHAIDFSGVVDVQDGGWAARGTGHDFGLLSGGVRAETWGSAGNDRVLAIAQGQPSPPDLRSTVVLAVRAGGPLSFDAGTLDLVPGDLLIAVFF